MGFRQERIEFYRLASDLESALESGGIKMITVQADDPDRVVGIGKQGVRTCVVWIDGERLFDEAARFVDILDVE